VSEDLRRSIRTEIEEIDASIGSLQSNVQNEQRNQNQLTKDLSHAKSEISNLRRGASDELDSATMNQQVRNRLAETLKVELVSAIVSPTSSCEAISESDSDTEEKMDDSIADGQGAHSKRKTVSLKSYIGTNFSEVKRLTYKIREHQKEKDAAEKETQSMKDERANVINRMARNNSENLLGIVEKEVQSHKKEQDAEARRKRSTQEVIQRARQRCGQYAQQIADRVSVS
jgi:chromosome segregation ATPase